MRRPHPKRLLSAFLPRHQQEQKTMPRPTAGPAAAHRLLTCCLLLVGPAAAAKCAVAGPKCNDQAGNASVTTLDTVPGSGWFQYLAVDDAVRMKYVYASDTSAHVVRRKAVATGTWEVLAGSEGEPGYRDGLGRDALLSAPTALCFQERSGHVVVADSGNACVRRIDAATGMVTTLAGSCGEKPGYRDGPAAEALFGASIRSLVCLPNCSVLVGDASVGRLRLIDVRGGGCVAAPNGPASMWAQLKWVLGGVVMLSILALGGKRAVDARAEAAARRMADVRAVHAVEADVAQVRPRREYFLTAAHRHHSRHHSLHSGAPQGSASRQPALRSLWEDEEPAAAAQLPPLLDLSAHESAGCTDAPSVERLLESLTDLDFQPLPPAIRRAAPSAARTLRWAGCFEQGGRLSGGRGAQRSSNSSSSSSASSLFDDLNPLLHGAS